MGAPAVDEVIRCVADTGPLLHVREANAGSLLGRLLEATCPPSVAEELETHAPGLWSAHAREGWLRLAALGHSAAMQSLAWRKAGLLDRGEADALALAQELKIGCLITDDAAARLMATSLGLQVRGSLGLVLEAARRGLLTLREARDTLVALRSTSLWVSARVFGEALRLLDEMA